MNLKTVYKYKIKKGYEYKENISKVGDKTIVKVSWAQIKPADVKSKAVLSSHSTKAGSTVFETEWSLKEGITATSVEDTEKFIKALTLLPSSKFYDIYSMKSNQEIVELLKKNQQSSQIAAGEKNILDLDYDKLAPFLIKMSKLLNGGTKFSMYSRLYKIIDDVVE